MMAAGATAGVLLARTDYVAFAAERAIGDNSAVDDGDVGAGVDAHALLCLLARTEALRQRLIH
jgi:hypothetical protein